MKNIVEWWKKKATNRFNTLKQESRIRTEMEVWTSGKAVGKSEASAHGDGRQWGRALVSLNLMPTRVAGSSKEVADGGHPRRGGPGKNALVVC